MVGVPRVVHLEDGKGSVLEIPMQISCPKMATIEKTRTRRKTILLSMVENLLLDRLEVRESLSLILSLSLSPSLIISHAEGHIGCRVESKYKHVVLLNKEMICQHDGCFVLWMHSCNSQPFKLQATRLPGCGQLDVQAGFRTSWF